MRIRSLLRTMVVPAVAIAGVVVAMAPAAAAPAPAREHCAVNIATGFQKCYSSMAEVLRSGTGEAAASVPLVTFYDGFDKGPASWTVSGPRACTASTSDYDYSDGTLVNNGWNDRISSVVTYSQCDVWFSSDINYEGECGNRWIDSQMDLRRDSCNNRASSYQLS